MDGELKDDGQPGQPLVIKKAELVLFRFPTDSLYLYSIGQAQAGNERPRPGVVASSQLSRQAPHALFFLQAINRTCFFSKMQAFPDVFPARREKSPVLSDPEIPLYGECTDQAWPIQLTWFLAAVFTSIEVQKGKVQKRWEKRQALKQKKGRSCLLP